MKKHASAIQFTGVNQLEIVDIEIPPPGMGELRLKTLACGICWRELYVYSGRLPRLLPVVMGHEPVGIIEAIGPEVKGFKEGDLVTSIGQSSFAEYCIVESKYSHILHSSINPVYLLGEPAMCALAAVRKADTQPNDIVVVNGIGFMGALLVQALATFANCTIIAVDTDPGRLEIIQSNINCQRIIAADFTPDKLIRDFGRLADIVFEASGVVGTIKLATSCTRNGGKLCIFGHHFSVENEAVNDWHLRGITVLNTVPWASPNLVKDFSDAAAMLDSGFFNMTSLITHISNISNAQGLFNTALSRSNNYVKGVFKFFD
jgi:threonine dehydrogenase-like Zn-dependent dehydrogenase